MKFNQLMVDVETTGLDPSHNAMIQLCAVPFDLEAREIDVEGMFSRCLRIPYGRYWDESTRTWWSSEKKRPVLEAIYARMEDPAKVMHDFAEHLQAIVAFNGRVTFWAKPVTFDFPYVASYMRTYGEHRALESIPYHQARDLNSYLAGRGIADPRQYVADRPFTGDRHNALYDCLSQLDALFAATKPPEFQELVLEPATA